MNASRFADVESGLLIAFHDARIADVAFAVPGGDAWKWLAQNHECNIALWAEEDLARRQHVPDAAIAANKRAIDRLNQQRNDAVERLDDVLLARLDGINPAADAWHNAETAGAMVDRMSILALKCFHMTAQTRRPEVAASHVATSAERAALLLRQRDDLARCLDRLLTSAESGRAFWRSYRQFKMYNDPAFNPQLAPRST